MKKFVLGILALCLVFAGLFGLTAVKNSHAVPEIPADTAPTAATEPAVNVVGSEDGTTTVTVAESIRPDATKPEEPVAESAEVEEPAAETAEAEEATPKENEVPEQTETEENAAPEEQVSEQPETEETPAEEAEPAQTPDQQPETETEAQPEEPSTVPEEQTVESGRLNYEALYSRYAPDEKVLSVNDKEERWGDYFYILFTQCGQIEDYFNSMAAYYGMQFGWADPIDEGGEESFADAAVESADNLMIQLGALEAFAEENGVEVSEEMRDLIEAQKQQDVVSALGEEGTMEAFEQYLETIHLSKEMYDRIVTQNFLYQESFLAMYGENGEKLSDDAAMKFLEDGGYVSAAHILLLNSDEETGEALDEAALAEKKAELETVIEELRAIEDNEERKAAFLQKATEITEDPGIAYYPEGYTFTSGTMVAEFEDAAKALEDYAISDVVETSYGYHILMRLPLSPEAIVEFNSSTGAPRTARMLAANQEYGEKLQQKAEELDLTWLPGYKAPDLMSYVAE